MANATSTIRVNIIGDARKLQSELTKADSSIGAVGRTAVLAGGAFAALQSADALVGFANDSLREFDRLGDAVARLDRVIGSDLSGTLQSTAEDFTRLGLSAQDVLELEASFAEFATGAGVAKDEIAGMADEAAATAAALSLIRDEDPATLLQLIAKAGDGSEKAYKALGISISDAEVETRALADTGKSNADQLTAQELAAARYKLVLDALKPALTDATTGTGDLEQKGRELEARWETLQAKIGGAIEGPLSDLLGWILSGIDGWEAFADALSDGSTAVDTMTKLLPALVGNLKSLLGPIGTAVDAFVRLRDAAADAFEWAQRSLGLKAPAPAPRQVGGGARSPARSSGGTSRPTVVVNTGADPERTVYAINQWTRGVQ